MGPRHCEVCEEAQSKYKCPTCLKPYCSLPCFKKHKETPCEKPVPSETIAFPTLPPKRSLQVDEPSQLLQKTQLESIDECSHIHTLGVQHYPMKFRSSYTKIDSSVAAESFQELDRAMEIEVFHKFTDKVLSMIGMQD